MIAKTPQIVEHVLLYNVSWEAYEQLLEAFGNRRLRHSYDGGTLEIMSPLKQHEFEKKLLGRLVEITALELDIDIQSIGSTTLRRRPDLKGLEPDECYYIQHEAKVRGKLDFDPASDPPPDLAIEVDVTHASVERMPIYAELGVPEVWRFVEGHLTFHRLSGSKYRKIRRSDAFPLVTAEIIQQFVGRARSIGENQTIREFLVWLRQASKGAK